MDYMLEGRFLTAREALRIYYLKMRVPEQSNKMHLINLYYTFDYSAYGDANLESFWYKYSDLRHKLQVTNIGQNQS